MKIAAIWAQDVNGALGDGKQMCWNVPDDFKHFKNSTMGSPIIMGRSSFEALGKPLPGRENIVITRQNDYSLDNAHVVYSIDEAIKLAKELSNDLDSDYIWITGGGQIYNQCMYSCDELVITYLDIEVKGEKLVYAPEISADEWEEDISRSDVNSRPASGDASSWKIKYYTRKN